MARIDCLKKDCQYGSSSEKCKAIFENHCIQRAEKDKPTCSFCPYDERCEALKLCPVFADAVKKIGL
ncbi:MAG: hypothetical protein ACM3UU_12055 [Ignavibacteriales bacterium]